MPELDLKPEVSHEEPVLDAHASAEANYQAAVSSPPGSVKRRKLAANFTKGLGSLLMGGYLAVMGVGVYKYHNEIPAPKIASYPLVQEHGRYSAELDKAVPVKDVLRDLGHYKGLEDKLANLDQSMSFQEQNNNYNSAVYSHNTAVKLLSTAGVFGLLPFFLGVGFRGWGKRLKKSHEVMAHQYEVDMRKKHLYDVPPQ